ncbi:putative bromodomain, histone-fold, Bromodomain-like superfamily, transcriptional activator Spt7 [Septoria linicola]|nr:putative bromodomain, histone-fold, Bromodomain-like superfamily, transcriptional activator Spt7 [Septoria linicola]
MSSTPSRLALNGIPRALNGANGSAHRTTSMTRESGLGMNGVAVEEEAEEDPIHIMLRARMEAAEAKLNALFGSDGRQRRASKRPSDSTPPTETTGAEQNAKTSAPPKKAAREIEDDYGDDDDEDEEDDTDKDSPLKARGKAALPNGLSPHAVRSPAPAVKPVTPTTLKHSATSASDQAKTSEDVRKQLEQEKKAAAETAKYSFQSMFFTLESDRDAMLEQRKLDELDREVDNEISAGPNGQPSASASNVPAASAVATQGSLGSADLGASSLTLKHLIARIDAKRDMVKASDNQLRTLISEVRKGRSKWASEDRVGQEELYEASEKVLMELKAMTEYAQPFLTRVSKREAPDYYNVITKPMDIGTMIKKLKQLAYKSKKEFVDDLNLIWANCLKYNAEPAHPLRKKALYMRKETDKLTPLIPEIVVRDRAEVEAEERRLHAGDEESDEDDAPIMASRGRKAPKKGGPTTTARKSVSGPAVAVEDGSTTPAPDTKPALHSQASNLRNDLLRADSEFPDAASAGFNTSPPGLTTPMPNGIHSATVPGSQADLMEIDGPSVISAATEDADEDDTEFKTWKQVTKKDRALAATERNRLFRGEHLNPEEPALLRTKAGMRRWIRQQRMISDKPVIDADSSDAAEDAKIDVTAGGETLAEGIEGEGDSTLPDYYNPLSAIPDLDSKWKWTTDSEGYAAPQTDEYMRYYPKDNYKIAGGALNKKMESNIRQMQETRKVCAKIGVVKQMQIQAQTYQNQFQKYEPEPFEEQDPGTVVVSEDGPLLAPWLNRAAFQKSIGKIFYHAGFEDFQPSAIDSMTDVAIDYFMKIGHTIKQYHEQPPQKDNAAPFTFEEQVLHTLDENGVDIESLESWVKDDVERQGNKLGVMHDRMKSHLADLLRPALGDHAGADGVGAFNDGSEQFVGGDFAEDLDEDFFGFRELGLAEEFGLETLSVPLHLLQNRMHAQYQAQNQGPITSGGLIFEPPTPYESVSQDTLPHQIGLVQDFFRNKLRTSRDDALVEDEDLPLKQKFPKPRLPPTGKITSPRKRPLREQAQAAKKKRKLEESANNKPIQPLKLQMPSAQTNGVDPEKNGSGDNDAPLSPPMSPDNN